LVFLPRWRNPFPMEKALRVGELEVIYPPGAVRPGLKCLWLSRRHKPLPAQLQALAKYGVGTVAVVLKLFKSFDEVLDLVDAYKPQVVVAVIKCDWILKLARARKQVEVLIPVFKTVYRGLEPPETWNENVDWLEPVWEIKRRKGKKVAERVYYVRRFTGFVSLKPATERTVLSSC